MSPAQFKAQHDYDLKQYIQEEQRDEVEANTVDYRGTPKSRLDEIEADAKARFEYAATVAAGLDSATIAKCVALDRRQLQQRNSFRWRQFGRVRVNGKWAVGPFWLGSLDEVRELEAILCPQSART